MNENSNILLIDLIKKLKSYDGYQWRMKGAPMQLAP